MAGGAHCARRREAKLNLVGCVDEPWENKSALPIFVIPPSAKAATGCGVNETSILNLCYHSPIIGVTAGTNTEFLNQCQTSRHSLEKRKNGWNCLTRATRITSPVGT